MSFGPENNWQMRGANPYMKKVPCLAILIDSPFPVKHKGTGKYQMPDEPGPAYFVANPDGTQGWVGVRQFESSYGIAARADLRGGITDDFWREAENADEFPCDQVVKNGLPAGVDLHDPHVARKLTPIWVKRHAGSEVVVPTTEGPMPMRDGDFLCESDESYRCRTTGEGDVPLDIWPVTPEFLQASYEPATRLIKLGDVVGAKSTGAKFEP